MPENRDGTQDRQFARVTTDIRAWATRVDEEQARTLSGRLLAVPSVWAPSEERSLQDYAARSTTPQAALARGILELSDAIVRLRSELMLPEPEAMNVRVVEISGSGGLIASDEPLEPGSRLDLWFRADRPGVPPVHTLVSIVHSDPLACTSGFSFEAIHPTDKDRLIRHTYSLQRRALRAAHEKEG